VVLVCLALACTGVSVKAADHAAVFTDEQLTEKVFAITRTYLQDCQDPKTHVVYLRPFSTKAKWTSPADVKAAKPMPWGYGSGIQDTSLNTGQLLGAFLAAHQARPDPFLRDHCRALFKAMQFIYSCTPVPGLVPRGPHPDDPTAVYNDSSMDQHTTFVISLALYATSGLADESEKAFVRKALQEVGERLEKYGWSIKRADGETTAHVGFAWTGMVHEHVSILLPTVLCLYRGTGNPHWRDAYERFGTEQDGQRWKLLSPGPHVRINGHPIYANQNCFRLNALYQFEEDTARKQIARDALAYSAKLQLEREYPNDYLLKNPNCDYAKLAQACGWDGATLKGCEDAWRQFKPSFFELPDSKLRANAMLAHLRFPLTGFHMALLSANRELITLHVASIRAMLNTVGGSVSEIGGETGGETRNLLAIVALHLYAQHFEAQAPPEVKP
jgi:hypothetical protein